MEQSTYEEYARSAAHTLLFRGQPCPLSDDVQKQMVEDLANLFINVRNGFMTAHVTVVWNNMPEEERAKHRPAFEAAGVETPQEFNLKGNADEDETEEKDEDEEFNRLGALIASDLMSAITQSAELRNVTLTPQLVSLALASITAYWASMTDDDAEAFLEAVNGQAEILLPDFVAKLPKSH